MKTMDHCSFLYILFVVQISICESSTVISWNPTSSIKFHANLALECRIESTERGIPKWSGGYSNHILTFNRASYYKEKYLVELNMQQMLYNLTILDFNEHDVNVLYTCYYGFKQYSKELTLDNGNFKMVPEYEHVSSSYANDILDLNITLEKVWPKPVCSLLINNKTYPEFTIEAVKPNGIFLDSEYTFRRKMNGNVELFMTCIIGTFETPYTITKHIEQEKTTSVTGENTENYTTPMTLISVENTKNNTIPMTLISLGGGCILFLSVILCVGCYMKIQKPEKWLKSTVGEERNVTKMKSGNLSVECYRQEESIILLSATTIFETEISATPHIN